MSFWRSYYHLVWATQDRNHWILPEFEQRLYAYLVSQAAELEVFVYGINGISDHVHIVAAIPPKHAVAWVAKTLKGSSSHWINHDLHPPAFHFAWQRGYGCLTMGQTQRPQAEAYVRDQKVHHQENTTNYWLEYCTEFDEGPDDIQWDNTPLTASPTKPKIMREEKIAYDISTTMPF